MENLIKIYKFNQTSDKKFGTIQLRIQVGFIFAKTPFKLLMYIIIISVYDITILIIIIIIV